jgi:glycosyltransferase involved in cell wall biosynthesis/SAM-dependent methyltransferase
LGEPNQESKDEIVGFYQNDIYLALDLNAHLTAAVQDIYVRLQCRGIKLYFIVYDILLVQHPEWWPEGTGGIFDAWLRSISEVSTGLLCISEAVADEVRAWITQNPPQRLSRPMVNSFHLGADVENSMPSKGIPDDAQMVLNALNVRPSFLMVGTVEPRKGHTQVLDAFELLWEQSVDANLVIVGKQGWLVDKLVSKLRQHSELNRRLFWLEGISDEYLEKIYAACTCLIAASEGEGFGLPLIEAAQHNKPIIARDMPVFREVAGEHAFYFRGLKTQSLVDAITTWLASYKLNEHPKSVSMPYLTWRESAMQLEEQLICQHSNGNDMVDQNNLSQTHGGLPALAEQLFPLRPQLPVPQGISEQDLFEFVTSVRVADAPEEEMRAYGSHDFRRFVYTLGLASGLQGKCLELGANPYFTTMLLEKFTHLELSLANYFGPFPAGLHTQDVTYKEHDSQTININTFSYQHFNVENDTFPYADSEFDVVIFAEIIEHLLNDPCKVLREIKRVLKPGGTIIVTTPNVARLENITRMVFGANIYDPYSGYGPYGRHNREYNRHELVTLLQFEGFDVIEHFTADVHENSAAHYADLNYLKDMLEFRKHDLGQYLFVKATNAQHTSDKVPSWLYRSLPAEQLA